MKHRRVRIFGVIRTAIRQLVSVLVQVDLNLSLLAVVIRVTWGVAQGVVVGAVLGGVGQFDLQIVFKVGLAAGGPGQIVYVDESERVLGDRRTAPNAARIECVNRRLLPGQQV